MARANQTTAPGTDHGLSAAGPAPMAGLRPASVHHTSFPGPVPRPIRPPAGPPRGDLPSPIFTRTSSLASLFRRPCKGQAAPHTHRFLEQWSQVVCASDTTIKEASLSQGPCPSPPINSHLHAVASADLLALASLQKALQRPGSTSPPPPPSRMDEVRGVPTHTPTHPHRGRLASQPASPPRRPPAPGPCGPPCGPGSAGEG